MSGWRVRVDHGLCGGTGLCAGVAPEVFTLNGETIEVAPGVVEPSDTVVDAAECCPSEAITITDAESGAVIAPV